MSDSYWQYCQARNAAWRTLRRFSTGKLPTDVADIAAQLHITVHAFPGPVDDPILQAMKMLPGSPVCRSVQAGKQWHVYFLAPLNENHGHFALAHELGHIILGHDTQELLPGVRVLCSSENQGDLIEAPAENWDYAADIFAIRLLAPACVLHDLHIDQSGQVAALCGMPPRAAALRADRMELLNRRNMYDAHRLEQQVHRMYLPFIRQAALRQAGGPPASDRSDEENAASPSPVAPPSPQQGMILGRGPDSAQNAPSLREKIRRICYFHADAQGKRLSWPVLLGTTAALFSIAVLLIARYG